MIQIRHSIRLAKTVVHNYRTRVRALCVSPDARTTGRPGYVIGGVPDIIRRGDPAALFREQFPQGPTACTWTHKGGKEKHMLMNFNFFQFKMTLCD